MKNPMLQKLKCCVEACWCQRWSYLKHLPVTGLRRHLWQMTPRWTFAFSFSAAVKSFSEFFTCFLSSFKLLKSCLHRGHFTMSQLTSDFWWSAQTFMQEMWMLLPHPNLKGTSGRQEICQQNGEIVILCDCLEIWTWFYYIRHFLKTCCMSAAGCAEVGLVGSGSGQPKPPSWSMNVLKQWR